MVVISHTLWNVGAVCKQSTLHTCSMLLPIPVPRMLPSGVEPSGLGLADSTKSDESVVPHGPIADTSGKVAGRTTSLKGEM